MEQKGLKQLMLRKYQESALIPDSSRSSGFEQLLQWAFLQKIQLQYAKYETSPGPVLSWHQPTVRQAAPSVQEGSAVIPEKEQ